jgi:hypothetical protein
MKRELTRCHLRSATSEAYDPGLRRARKFVVQQSVAEYSLEEPIGAAHDDPGIAAKLSAAAAAEPQRVQAEGLEGICANPLREEPHPAVVGAVKRFGVVGLVACAVGTAVGRWCRSLSHRAR